MPVRSKVEHFYELTEIVLPVDKSNLSVRYVFVCLSVCLRSSLNGVHKKDRQLTNCKMKAWNHHLIVFLCCFFCMSSVLHD